MNKKLALITVLILMIGRPCFAGGFVKNPDRYPSVGLSFGLADLEGTRSETTSGASFGPRSQNSGLKTRDVTIDLRLPVSHEVTLFGAFSVLSQETSQESAFLLDEADNNLDGYGFRIGARYYFNR